MRIILLFLVSAILFSCNATKQLAAPPSVERTITITQQVHDTVLVVKADTVRVAAKLEVNANTGRISIAALSQQKPLPNIPKVYNGTSSTGRALAPNLSIDSNNNLSVECFCDSAAIVAKLTNTIIHDSTTVTPAPVIIKENRLTWWQKVQVWCGRIFLIMLLLLLLLKGYSIYEDRKTLPKNGR